MTQLGRLGTVLGLAVLTLAVPPAARAAGDDGLTLARGAGRGSSRAQVFRQQVRFLDSQLAEQYGAPQGRDGAAARARYTGAYRGKYMQMARTVAQRYGIPEGLFLRLVQRESGWDHGAVSHKGARGLAQLMPATARKLGVDYSDPRENLEGGARYLRMMYDRFGSWRLALAAYNAGPEAVERNGGVPPYRETRNYVRAILGNSEVLRPF